MTEKRFTTDNGSHEDVCLVDNLTKKEYESNFEDMVSLMNDIWNQTQRFEKHNQRLEKENEQLKSKNRGLQSELQIFKEDATHSNLQINKLADENEQLKKDFHSVSHNWALMYDEAKNKVEELSKENEQLKSENQELKKYLSWQDMELEEMEDLND